MTQFKDYLEINYKFFIYTTKAVSYKTSNSDFDNISVTNYMYFFNLIVNTDHKIILITITVIMNSLIIGNKTIFWFLTLTVYN